MSGVPPPFTYLSPLHHSSHAEPLAELLLHTASSHNPHLFAKAPQDPARLLIKSLPHAGIPLATRYVLSPVPHPQPHASSAPATPSTSSPTRTVAMATPPRKQLSGWTSTTRLPWVCLVARNRAPLSVPAHCSGCRCLWPWSACHLRRSRRYWDVPCQLLLQPPARACWT